MAPINDPCPSGLVGPGRPGGVSTRFPELEGLRTQAKDLGPLKYANLPAIERANVLAHDPKFPSYMEYAKYWFADTWATALAMFPDDPIERAWFTILDACDIERPSQFNDDQMAQKSLRDLAFAIAGHEIKRVIRPSKIHLEEQR